MYGCNQKGIGKIPQWVELLLSDSDDGSLTSREAGEEEEMNDGEDKLDTDQEDDETESDCDNEHSEDKKKHSPLDHVMVLIHYGNIPGHQ